MRSKTRLIAAVASLLVCLAMVGTGFASWVILGTESANATGNVKADTIADQSIKEFKATIDSGKQNIVYGGMSGSDNSSGKWLINDNTTASLSTSIVLSAKSGTIGSLSATFSASADWDTAVSAGLITAPVLSVDENSASYISITDGDGEKKDATPDTYTYAFSVTGGKHDIGTTALTINVTFGWGSLFETSNPYTYFNSKQQSGKIGSEVAGAEGLTTLGLNSAITQSTTWKDYALALLTKLNELLGESTSKESGTTFTFTFEATSAQAAA